MSTFQSEKVIPVVSPDLGDVARAVEAHFRKKGFDVTASETLAGTWHISIHRGNLFKAVLGLKTALNITIETVRNGTLVNAGVGVFGQQAVPAAITLFIFWPVLITQIWGLVQQSKLDDEAMACIEGALVLQPRQRRAQPQGDSAPETAYCTGCGQQVEASARFCPGCGHPLGQRSHGES